MPQRSAPRFLVLALTLGFLMAPALLVAQYTVPGSLAELPSDRKERVEQAMREARWGSGRFRLDPWITISDGGYLYEDRVQPDGSTKLEGDFSATAGAGLRTYLRAGSRLILAAHGKLDYLYWADHDERRRSLGQFGAGLFGEAGRLGMEITATRAETQNLLTAESLRYAPHRVDEARGELDLQLGHGLFLRFGGGESRFRLLDPEKQGTVPFTQLDRDEQRLSAAIGHRLRSGLVVTFGYEESTTDFVAQRDRSNDGTAVIAGLAWEAPRFSLHGSFARREMESRAGSTFGSFEGTTYRVQAGLGGRRGFSPVIYAQRELAYTLDVTSSYALDERRGISLGFPFGHRATVTAFYETGELEYHLATGEAGGRRDDLTAWGATAELPLRRSLRFQTGYRLVEYDSNLPGADRRTRQIVIGLAFGTGSRGPWY
ncbi:MAG TPA: hypothetical protein PKX99_06055 [Thermoanaerobaculia bacterium]|nr:hypothetical protein [Thermoanaerobaculia bacterium]